MNEQSLAAIKAMQLGEITEHVIYGYMARRVPGENGRTLARIAAEEKKPRRNMERLHGRDAEAEPA